MKKIICGLAVAAFLGGCASPGSAPIGQYDFQYQVKGDASTRPYQVFDDGQHTYFQFRDVPAKLEVHAVTPSGLVTLNKQTSVNYVRVGSVVQSWQLDDGGKSYTITYTGSVRDNQIKAGDING